MIAMIGIAVAMTLMQAPDAGVPAPGSDLPAEAKIHNDRGVALVIAGQYEAGVAELERAYAGMPDPLRYRAGRGKVLGSLRSALQQQYAATGAFTHLCRLRGLLRWHREALLAALGPAGRVDDVAGTDEAIREIDATLGRHSCSEPARPLSATPKAPSLTMKPAPLRRGVRIAGGVLIGVGFASLGVMTYGLAAMADNRDKLRSLTESVEASGSPPDREQEYAAAGFFERAYERRSLGIVTGVLGGVAVLTGLALRIAGRRRAEALGRVPVGPVVGPGHLGVVGRFAF